MYCLLSYLFVPQDNSWTRRVPVCHSVHLAPLLTLPLCCVRNAHQTVSRVWTTVITASAAPKVAINRFTTGGAVGETAQSKSLDNLSVIIAFFCFYLYWTFWLMTVASMRPPSGRVKPVIAPVWHAMASRPNVCPALMGIFWRAARVASTAPCGRTLQTMAPAAAAPRIVTSVQTTGTVSVSYRPSGRLRVWQVWINKLQVSHLYSTSFQNAASSIWCCTVCARLVAPGAITRIWRKAAVVSAILPVAPVLGPWRTTARAAQN